MGPGPAELGRRDRHAGELGDHARAATRRRRRRRVMITKSASPSSRAGPETAGPVTTRMIGHDARAPRPARGPPCPSRPSAPMPSLDVGAARRRSTATSGSRCCQAEPGGGGDRLAVVLRTAPRACRCASNSTSTAGRPPISRHLRRHRPRAPGSGGRRRVGISRLRPVRAARRRGVTDTGPASSALAVPVTGRARRPAWTAGLGRWPRPRRRRG